jgi:uncharacterized protein
MKAINWFQIPAADLARATKFYGAVVGAKFSDQSTAMGKHAFFMDGDAFAGGEVVQSQGLAPSDKGVVIYLDAPDGVDAALAKVPGAGGSVLMPRTDISPHGFIAWLRDTEGNTVGLHSMSA